MLAHVCAYALCPRYVGRVPYHTTRLTIPSRHIVMTRPTLSPEGPPAMTAQSAGGRDRPLPRTCLRSPSAPRHTSSSTPTARAWIRQYDPPSRQRRYSRPVPAMTLEPSTHSPAPALVIGLWSLTARQLLWTPLTIKEGGADETMPAGILSWTQHSQHTTTPSPAPDL